jgi:hypothetical protein
MQNRKSPERPAQPMRSATRDGEAAQDQEARRSGQLARLTEEIRAGEKTDCCDDAAFVGGDRKQSPQQPCSRHLYNAGRVRLPGGHGLDGTCRPGRRRAKARYVRRLASFSRLQFYGYQLSKAAIVDAFKSAARCSIHCANPITRRYRATTAHSFRGFVSNANVRSEVGNGRP